MSNNKISEKDIRFDTGVNRFSICSLDFNAIAIFQHHEPVRAVYAAALFNDLNSQVYLREVGDDVLLIDSSPGSVSDDDEKMLCKIMSISVWRHNGDWIPTFTIRVLNMKKGGG